MGEMTWDGMARIEPDLGVLLNAARCVQGGERAWNWIRGCMERYVGWHAADPRLRSDEAWQLAWDVLEAAFHRRRSRRA